MGLAMTDGPASIATEPFQFNRQNPGTLLFSGDATEIEMIEEALPIPEVGGFFAALTDMVKKFGTKEEPKPELKIENPASDLAAFTSVMGEFAKTIDAGFAAQAKASNDAIAALSTKFTELEASIENTVDPAHQNRPKANGNFTANIDDVL